MFLHPFVHFLFRTEEVIDSSPTTNKYDGARRQYLSHSAVLYDQSDTFTASLKLDFPLLVVGKETSNAFESRMVPTTFLIDGNGHILREFVRF